MKVDGWAFDPEPSRWPRDRVLRYAGWTAVIVGIFVAEWVRPEVRWLPGLGVVGMLIRDILEGHRESVAVRNALSRLQSCFHQATEPDLSAVFAALAGADKLAPISTATQWSDRYQRGMMTKEEYYSGMRQFVHEHCVAT